MLYPIQNETRNILSLDGIWNFSLIPENGERNASSPLSCGMPMPVPCSYNDIYEGRNIRDHAGWVVYERFAELPETAHGLRYYLHFGSVTHTCEIYWNGNFIGSHKGGFLPFEIDVTEFIRPGSNRLTVFVNNVVDHTTLPCGTVQRRQYPGMEVQYLNFPNFDFFNYSGIMRPVKLLSVLENHIDHISVSGTADGAFRYEIRVCGEGICRVVVKDEDKIIWEGSGTKGGGTISDIIPWHPDHPKMYLLDVSLSDNNGRIDHYTEKFGFRTIEVHDCGFYLNGEKTYLKGFGKHEDTPVLGRGFSDAFNVKDLALMKWINANSFRTSHYPYSEEMMNLCDQMGILVIDEVSAVGMHTTFTASGMQIDVKTPTWKALKTQQHHLDMLHDLIERDENHPCVVMWSVANEPASEEPGAGRYFEPLFNYVREKDPQHRPVSFATHGEASVDTCEVASLCDVLMLNRYYGWYGEEANISAAKALLSDELDRYHSRYPDKPIMLSEFGADAVAGLHDSTPLMFSEEFQRDLIAVYCEVLDSKPYVFGEHVWNFADFATAESVRRVQGNKKGVFTRERKPKFAAWYLKDRWEKIK